jgi:hypothetical protein
VTLGVGGMVKGVCVRMCVKGEHVRVACVSTSDRGGGGGQGGTSSTKAPPKSVHAALLSALDAGRAAHGAASGQSPMVLPVANPPCSTQMHTCIV